MKNNKLIIYKKCILDKIFSFIKKIFWNKTVLPKEVININNEKKESFIRNIKVKEDKEELRLLQLKQQYDNGEIDTDDLSEEDIDKLCKIYEEETEKLNADTKRRKNHIIQMLKELKSF